jgi:predicted nucleic acid-binding protein
MSSDSEWVLVDSNLWILFLKEPSPLLRQLLKAERAMTHSCVIGEFLVGSIQYREMMRKFMCGLPKVGEVSPEDTLAFMENNRLWGKGLQWNDMLLLASAKLSGVKLWTLDKRLAQAAEEMGVA